MPNALLDDRGVIQITGEEARGWLNNLVTCDVATLKSGEARWGALLTPQGKIIADFLVAFGNVEVGHSYGVGFYLDTPRPLIPDLLKRLALYRLRAKVGIVDLSSDSPEQEQLGVVAGWATPCPGWENPLQAGALFFADPRSADLGQRQLMPRHDAEAIADGDGAAAYHAHRIALGIPEGGQDFAYGDAFPHEANMDQLGGIDFKKGCYVGQEVVSRMQHRGSGGRTRVAPVAYEGGFAASEGIEVKAGEKILGSTGSNANGRGLAKLRLDRVEDAIKAGETLTAGGIALKLVKPDWATFRFPGEDAAS